MVIVAWCATGSPADAADAERARIERVVDAAIRPVMAQYDIAGMAVGITIAGRATVFDYGVASKETRRPVTPDTLFEIGPGRPTASARISPSCRPNVSAS